MARSKLRWNNVNANANAGSQSFGSGSRMIANALKGLEAPLQRNREIVQQNALADKSANTGALMRAILKGESPEMSGAYDSEVLASAEYKYEQDRLQENLARQRLAKSGSGNGIAAARLAWDKEKYADAQQKAIDDDLTRRQENWDYDYSTWGRSNPNKTKEEYEDEFEEKPLVQLTIPATAIPTSQPVGSRLTQAIENTYGTADIPGVPNMSEAINVAATEIGNSNNTARPSTGNIMMDTALARIDAKNPDIVDGVDMNDPRAIAQYMAGKVQTPMNENQYGPRTVQARNVVTDVQPPVGMPTRNTPTRNTPYQEIKYSPAIQNKLDKRELFLNGDDKNATNNVGTLPWLQTELGYARADARRSPARAKIQKNNIASLQKKIDNGVKRYELTPKEKVTFDRVNKMNDIRYMASQGYDKNGKKIDDGAGTKLKAFTYTDPNTGQQVTEYRAVDEATGRIIDPKSEKLTDKTNLGSKEPTLIQKDKDFVDTFSDLVQPEIAVNKIINDKNNDSIFGRFDAWFDVRDSDDSWFSGIGDFLQTDDSQIAKDFEQAKNTMLGKVVKTMGSNPSDVDMKNILSQLPSRTDTRETAQRKVKNFMGSYYKARADKLRRLSKTNPSAVRATLLNRDGRVRSGMLPGYRIGYDPNTGDFDIQKRK